MITLGAIPIDRYGPRHPGGCYEGKRPRTWVTLTPAGLTALRAEIAHLKQLIQQVEQATSEQAAP